MKRLEVNPSNEHYYTKDFISGFRCGTKRQFESDVAVLDKIRAEIIEVYNDRPSSYNHTQRKELFCKVIEIIDKNKAESEEV